MQTAQIRVERVDAESFAPKLRIPADVRADPESLAQVGARTAGRVLSINVRLGDSVHRGDPVVEIATVELHQVAMEYLTAIARSRQASAELARQRQLVNERIGAQADLQRAQADAAAAQAALREGEEHLHFLGLSDREIQRVRAQTSHGEARSSVRAPIDGRVESIDVSLGQVVSGTENLVTIAQLETVWVSLRVYERDAEHIRVGTPIEVVSPAVPDRRFRASISFVSAIVDPATRTFEARAAVENHEGLLRPGTSATAEVPLSDPTGRSWIPVGAVQPHDGRTIVFVQVGDRRFAMRYVQVGEERNGYVPIMAGLAIGDLLVTQGAFALRGELERADLEQE
jgi:cobalt-zinc-cadmium efflux system membrane fusion protein